MATDCLKEERMRRIKSVKSNVLVIEDDQDTAEMIVQFLQDEGYAVSVTNNRQDAIPVMYGNIYHFIVMDLFMSGMSASEFLKRVARASPLSKLILITAAPIVDEEAEKLGVAVYLGKPFKLSQLLDVIENCGS